MGEFQKFLTAKSDERGEILGKLYDNRQHQDFQLRLKAARELLKEQEPVKPRFADGVHYTVNKYLCGACGHHINQNSRYCEGCGRAVKWE